MPSREPGYSGCLTLEGIWDDSTDLAGPNEVEQFNLASGSFTLGKLLLQQLMWGGTVAPVSRQPICGGHLRSQGSSKPDECRTFTLKGN